MGPSLAALVATALDAVAFRTWLAQRGPSSFFLVGSMAGCPLAAYLQDVVPRPPHVRIAVYTAGVSVTTSSLGALPLHRVHLPPWAQLFVEQVDLCLDDGTGRRVIAAADALAVLDRVLVQSAS